MKRFAFISIGLAIVAGVLISACTGSEGKQGPKGDQGVAGSAGALGKDAPVPPGAGVNLAVTKVEVPADRKPVVTFTMTDAVGKPLKLSDVDDLSHEVPVPGVMNVRFTIARLQQDSQTKLTQWQTYILAPAQGQPYTFKGAQKQPAIAQGTQPNILMDMGGSYKEVSSGTYTYTFGTALPDGYDRNATHRVGGETSREGRKYVANATFDFVPSGAAVTVTRQVVAVQSCNQCHDPLALHGGLRQETKLCVICHTSQNIDSESGNVLQFNQMVHRIHYGANSPAVKAGTPYIIKGFPPQPVDFSTVVFPQFGGPGGSTIGDVRTCTVCHGAPPKAGSDAASYPAVQFPSPTMSDADYAKLAPNADNYKTAPSRAACGSCHNQIDFATGKALFNGPAGTKRDHPGGAQANDQACALCHQADTGQEFDVSVVGAHTLPARSKQLGGVNVEIVRVTDTKPGNKPTVVFKATDNAGKVLPLSAITSVAFNVKGPTTDYVSAPTAAQAKATESIPAANIPTSIKTDADGNFTYTLANAIPADAKGTWAIAMEVGRSQVIKGNEGADLTVNQRTYNPVAYVPVTDEVAVPRRQVVATSKCNVCHGEIAFHGGSRKSPSEVCVLCHNPSNVDNPAGVTAANGGPIDAPAQSINFKLLIHRVHTGEDLTRDFTIYRSNGVFNFNEVRFPGDRRNCEKCHIPGSNLLPLPATAANTVAPRELYSPLGPAAAACLGCHDSTKASAHASTMTTPFGEACAVCHGEGRDFAVTKVHDRSKLLQEVPTAVQRATGVGSYVADNGDTFGFAFTAMQLDGKGNAVGEYQHRNTTKATLIVVKVLYMKLVGNELWLGGTITKAEGGTEGQPGEDRVIRFQDNFPGTDQRTRMQKLNAGEALNSPKTGNLADANLRPLVSGNIAVH
ncbi:MAG: OmcA/MtrC family decaheme c-type cytochrome [Dehalococcoidia bacterium]|nr:OmcA/MtrC family decaheme c-type cytochrome [Dehalococcoidia bacterium]